MPWWGWIVLGCLLLGSELVITTDFYLAILGAAALTVAAVASLTAVGLWALWRVSQPEPAKEFRFPTPSGERAGLTPEIQAALRQTVGANEGDLIFFSADQAETVNKVLAAVRRRIAADLELYDPDAMAWCWVVDWPLFEYDAEGARWNSLHHPFTTP